MTVQKGEIKSIGVVPPISSVPFVPDISNIASEILNNSQEVVQDQDFKSAADPQEDPLGDKDDKGEEEDSKDSVVPEEEEKSVADIEAEKKPAKEKKSVIADDTKEFFEDVEDSEEEVVPDGDKKTSRPQTSKMSAEDSTDLSRYREILKNPLAKSFLNAIEMGQDPIAIIDAVRPIKLSESASAEEIIRAEMSLDYPNGIVPQEDFDAELYDFENKPTSRAKMVHLNALKARIAEVNKTKQNSVVASQEQQIELNRAIWSKHIQEAESISQSMVGKEIYGYKVLPEDAKDINKYCLDFNTLNADGTVNTKKIAQLGFLDLKIRSMLRKNGRDSASKAEIKILDSINRPDKQENVSSRSSSSKQLSKEESVESIVKQL